MYNFVSAIGVLFFIGAAWLISKRRKEIQWRTVAVGIGIQLAVAAVIFVLPGIESFLIAVNTGAEKLIGAAESGSLFLFGPLAISPGKVGSLGFILMFQGLPTIIFFSSLMAMLYYFGVMQWIIKRIAGFFTWCMKISGAEGLCAASNIFVGIESAFTVRPYLKRMTASELCLVLTAGMATVASNVLALYIITLKGVFPTIAGHLISASFISAPAAIVMAKILYPETEEPLTLGKKVELDFSSDETTVFEAILNGANNGLKVIGAIAAMLIAVLGLMALLDGLVGAVGDFVQNFCGVGQGLSLSGILKYLFYPFALAMGVPLDDALLASEIIGKRLVFTEVASYQQLAEVIGDFKNERSAVITAYALCGFAHFASMGIFAGGLTAIAPERKKVIARVVFRALLAATFACLLTGAVAGIFCTDSMVLLSR